MGVGVLRSVRLGEEPDLAKLKSGRFVQLSIKFWNDRGYNEEEYNEWVWVRVDLIEDDSMLGTIAEELFVASMPGGAEFKYGSPILFEKHNIFILLEDAY